MSKGLSYTVSSVSANVAEDFSVTLELGAAQAEEVVALGFLHIDYPCGLCSDVWH